MRSGDQAQLPLFQGLLVLLLVVGAAFGLAPMLIAHQLPGLTGFIDDQPFIYRLAGAATLGYGVVGLLALVRHSAWAEVRIPMIAILTFNAAAFVGTVRTLLVGTRQLIVFLVLVASAAFTLLAAYWLRRNQGPDPGGGAPISQRFRVVILLATAAALVFGVIPLLFPMAFSDIGGLPTTNHFALRLAAAATLGYGVAGIFEYRTARWPQIWLQVVAAAVFNGFSALAALVYLVHGGRSWVAALILVAATFFAVALGLGASSNRNP